MYRSIRIVGLLIINILLIASCNDKKKQQAAGGGSRQQGPLAVDGFVVVGKFD